MLVFEVTIAIAILRLRSRERDLQPSAGPNFLSPMLLELLSLGSELLCLVLVGRDEQLFADGLVQILVHNGWPLRLLATSAYNATLIITNYVKIIEVTVTALWDVLAIICRLVFLDYSVKVMLDALYLAVLI